MIKAIIFKEWIKLRYLIILLAITEISYSLYLCLKLIYQIRLAGAVKMLDVIISDNYIFFSPINKHFLIVGTLIALFQFMPEMKNKCLKLTLHVPYNNNKMLINMLSISSCIFSLYSLLMLGIFLSVTAYYFPLEIVKAYALSIFPWIVSGFMAYFFTSSICIESQWNMRVLLIIVGYFISQTLLLSEAYFAYQDGLIVYILILLSTILLSYLSLQRFKTGK